MKSPSKFRMSMMAIGFGAAILLAAPARAQQEVDPTYFDITPGTPAIKAAPVRTAQEVPAAVQKSGNAESALAIATGKDATLEAGLTRVLVLDIALALIFVGGFASIVAYALLATKRAYIPGGSYHPNRPYAAVSASPVQ
jgi:hypothetical protein